MKKNKMTTAILTSLLACAALAGCSDVKEDKQGEGYVLTFKDSNGNEKSVKADELFDEYYNTTTGAKSMFDSVYELLIRSYYDGNSSSHSMDEFENYAKNQVKGVKETAKSNKETNGSNYNDEFDALLDSYGVDSEDELFEHFKYQEMKSTFEEDFYKDNIEDIRSGKFFKDIDSTSTKGGYIAEMSPYHVKHILINVSAANGSHYNGEISKDEAKKIGDIFTLLANGGTAYDFGSIAKEYSDDTGSKANYGDLGIMDKSTGYINEFKLGVYAFDALYNGKITEPDAVKAALNIPETIHTNDGLELGTIPFGLFEKMIAVADVDEAKDGSSVNDGKAFFYPRNVYFNKYLNKHFMSLVTYDALPDDSDIEMWATTNSEEGKLKATSSVLSEPAVGTTLDTTAITDNPRWKLGSELGLSGYFATKYVLTDGTNPLLVVRGGTSSYQGIHIIAVEKNPFVATADELDTYYTTYYPGQKNYPMNGDAYAETFVNIRNDETKTMKERAETVISTIKGYDANFDTYIFDYLKVNASVNYADTPEGQKVGAAIEEYIDSKRAKSIADDENNWEDTWNTYFEYLEQQEIERGKLLSAICAIKYEDHTEDPWKAMFEYGGMCSYVK